MEERAEPVSPQNPAEMPADSARVFISYASQDATVAQNVCAALEAAGYSCWIAPRDVIPGMLYAEGIVRAINDSKILVLILSESAVASAHVGKEIERASSKRHPIIALRTDHATLPPAFEYFLNESQWIDIAEGGTDDAIAKLISAAGRHLSPRSPAAPNHSFDANAAGRAVAILRRPWYFAAGVVVLAFIAAYLLADKLWLHGLRGSTDHGGSGPSQTTIGEKSIAVLPFADMSEKKDQGYFADGMAEEILGLLAKIPRLTVISRTSSFQFKGRDVDVKTIGATLGTRYIVEGSVRKSSDQFRITAQLIDARDGSQRWSETYNRNIGDAFKVQDEIAASLVRALELVVGAGEMPTRLNPKNPASYDLYLRGLQAFDRFNRDGFEQAADMYQQALDLDPQFAPAASALAEVQVFMTQWGHVAPKIGYERARQAAELAIKLDPHLAGPHRTLAAVHAQYDWDWPGAMRESERAIALEPRDAASAAFRGLTLLSVGRVDEATSQLNSASRLDPLSPVVHFNLGWARFWSGHLPEAEEAFRRTLQISPTYESAHYYLGHVLFARGDLAGALAEMERESDEESRLAGLASLQFEMGRKRESDATLDQLTKLSADDWASGIASVHAIRNEPEAAFEWLDRAYAQKDEDLYVIKGNPLFRNVARDPRYAAFLRKMNLPE